MGNFNRDSTDRPMFQAVCAECGKSCEVPFKPTGSKPVLCRDCFRATQPQDRGDSRRDNYRDDRHADRRPRSQDSSRSSVREIETYSPGISGMKSTEHFDQQFNLLNEKLDRILKRLTPAYLRENKKVMDESESADQSDETESSQQ